MFLNEPTLNPNTSPSFKALEVDLILPNKYTTENVYIGRAIPTGPIH